jgi:hypothetical protein
MKVKKQDVQNIGRCQRPRVVKRPSSGLLRTSRLHHLLKMAPTVALSLIIKVHVVAVSGVQLADQPPKPGDVADNVTDEPRTKLAVHPVPEPVQLIPGGVLVTVPEPKPTR